MKMNTKSNEQFLSELKERKPQITALELYQGRGNPIRVRCDMCGREWITTPRNLLTPSNGTGCKDCSNRSKKRTGKTIEQIQRELETKNGINIIGKFQGIRKNTECKCLKCGYHWFPRIDRLLEGHGCPQCNGSRTKTNEEFYNQLSKINSYVVLLSDYVNSKTKILCRCKYCGHEWEASPNHLLWGTGCPKCSDKMKTSFPEQALFFYIKKNYSDAINRYKIPKSKLELDIFIPELRTGIEYDGVYWHKNKKEKEDGKYELCKERDIRLVRIREEKNVSESADEVIIRNSYKGFKSLDQSIIKLLKLLECKYINVDSEKDANMIRGQFYSEMRENSLSERFPELVKEWFQEKNGDITPNMISSGSNDKYWWKCNKCGYVWKTQVCDRSIGGKGCKKCADKNNADRMRKQTEELQLEIDKLNIEVDIIGEYKGTHNTIKVKCRKCGAEWDTVPTTLLRGRKCRFCMPKTPYTSIKKTHEEFVSEAQLLNPNLVFLGKYDGNKNPIATKCKVCGQILKLRPADLYHGHYKKHLHL